MQNNILKNYINCKMISSAWFIDLCLSLDNTSAHPHFEKTSFRVNKKIFATLDVTKIKASLKLSEIDQSIFCDFNPEKIYPANGAWGKQGWTIFEFSGLKPEMIKDALTLSYNNVSIKKK